MSAANSLSWTAFVMTLAAFTSPPVLAELSQAPDSTSNTANQIEHRLSRITNTLKAAELQLAPEQIPTMTGLNGGQGGSEAGGGFGNARGGGGFANTRGPGWVNGGGGGTFVNNANPWRNAWADGGGFINRY